MFHTDVEYFSIEDFFFVEASSSASIFVRTIILSFLFFTESSFIWFHVSFNSFWTFRVVMLGRTHTKEVRCVALCWGEKLKMDHVYSYVIAHTLVVGSTFANNCYCKVFLGFLYHIIFFIFAVFWFFHLIFYFFIITK